jgi:thioredoxin-related protein
MWLLLASLLGLVQPAIDLQLTAREARQARLPILLYVSRSDCTFCRKFEAQVFNPLIRSGAIAEQIIIRELVWDLPGLLRDFSGRSVAPAAIAEAYDAKLTPTLLFLDAHGNEVVKRITGYRESDYFSYYLEAAITNAGATMRRPTEKAQP